ELRPDLSPSFADAVERALATDPRNRFANAEEMRVALSTPARSAVKTVPLQPPTPATKTMTLPVPARRPAPARATPRARVDRVDRVWRAIAATVVTAVLVVAIVLLATRG